MANQPTKRTSWEFYYDGSKPIIKSKQRLIEFFIRLFFNRTITMFEYDGLPEELPQRQIELIMQTHRFVVFPKDLIDGKHYAMFGGLGYEPDGYYEPSKAILVNPFLKYHKILDIKKQYKDGECVVIYNDAMHMGLIDLHEMYAQLLAENIISLRYGTVNARVLALMVADNDSTKESADEFFTKIEKGEDVGVVAGTPFFDNMKSLDYGKGADSTHIKELIEERQYLMSAWWNDLGINANFNMKRESINESEASMGELALLPLTDDMLKQRQIGIEQLNKLWGTNITVKFSSAWERLRNQLDTKEKVEESQIQTPKETGDETPVEESKSNEEETD